MPTKMATCCRKKAVLVTVYVERPRRKMVQSRQPHHHHHHHLHVHQPIIRPEVTRQKGFNRKADLLHYSQRLRESARTTASSPSHRKPVFSNNQKHATQIVPVRSKPKYARTPTCLGNWRLLIPNFLRSMTTSLQAKKERRKKKKNNGSTSKKIKAVVKRIEVQKKWGSVSKMFAMLRKHR